MMGRPQGPQGDCSQEDKSNTRLRALPFFSRYSIVSSERVKWLERVSRGQRCHTDRLIDDHLQPKGSIG